MSGRGVTRLPLMPAHFVLLGAAQWALAWVWFSPMIAGAGAAGAFLLLLVAAMTSGFGVWGPSVTRGKGRGTAVALWTRHTDLAALLEAVDKPVALFLTARQASDTTAVKELVSRGCELGIRVDGATWSPSGVREQLRNARAALARAGIASRFALGPRSESGPALWPALLEEGMLLLRPSGGSGDGAIVELSDEQLAEMPAGVRKLSEVLGCPVMTESGKSAAQPAELFYDAHAATYDAEQQEAKQSGLRGQEMRLVQAGLIDKLDGSERVLELGAGTGRITVLLAARAKSVVATDVSEEMLAVLRRKAPGVEARKAELAGPWPEGPFDVVCSLSAMEYERDLDAVLKRAAETLRLGGRLYVTTAHTCVFRLATQVGNAMRQGIWLHGRTVGEFRRALAKAGFSQAEIATHGPGGMLMSVSATKTEPRA